MTSGSLADHGVGPALRQQVVFSSRRDGSFHLDDVAPLELEVRRRRLVDRPWSQPDEVHGTEVLVVGSPGEHDRRPADALVTTLPDVVLGIWTGDCAPVALLADGVIGAAHAGWRGVRDGVLAATVERMRHLGAGDVRAVVGPCIHPCCNEFGAADLDGLADRFGPTVRGRTRGGAAAFDLPAAVAVAGAELGVPVAQVGGCTGCGAADHYSHRVRAERGRQIMGVWQAVAS